MVVSGMSTVLVCGDAHGLLSLRAIWSLLPLRTIDHSLHGAIKCMSFTEGLRQTEFLYASRLGSWQDICATVVVLFLLWLLFFVL